MPMTILDRFMKPDPAPDFPREKAWEPEIVDHERDAAFEEVPQPVNQKAPTPEEWIERTLDSSYDPDDLMLPSASGRTDPFPRRVLRGSKAS